MTAREVSILNSLVTYAAENIPGGLKPDERQVAQTVGLWATDHVIVRPVCPHCFAVAPYGEGRIPWLQYHMDTPGHRWWWGLRNKFHKNETIRR